MTSKTELKNSMDKTGAKYVLRDPALHHIVTSLY